MIPKYIIVLLALTFMIIPACADHVHVNAFSSSTNVIIQNTTSFEMRTINPVSSVTKVSPIGVQDFYGYGTGELGNIGFMQDLTVCAESSGYSAECVNIKYDPVEYGLSTFDIFDLGTHYVTIVLTESSVVEEVDGIVNIVVRDYETHAAIPGVTIHHASGTVTTNSNGFAQLVYQTIGSTVSYTIYKSGYQQQTIMVAVEDEVQNVEVMLIPIGITATPTITTTPLVMETRSFASEYEHQTLIGNLIINLTDIAPWIFIGAAVLVIIFAFVNISPKTKGILKFPSKVLKVGKGISRSASGIRKGFHSGRKR